MISEIVPKAEMRVNLIAETISGFIYLGQKNVFVFLCFAGFHHRRDTIVASTAGDLLVKLRINTKGKGGIILPNK